MDTPLFPDLPEVLSPFLRWKKAERLHTWKTETEETPWTCCSEQHVDDGLVYEDTATIGETEEQACEEYCLKFKVKHWSLQ